MAKVPNKMTLCSRIIHSIMKGYVDGDSRRLPAVVFDPGAFVVWEVFSVRTECFERRIPINVDYVAEREIGLPEDCYELLEVDQGLAARVPVPLSNVESGAT